VIAYIATSDAIDVARMIARSEGYDIKKTAVYSFDLLTREGGKPFVQGYTTIGLYINGNPRDLIAISGNTGQAIDYNTCEIFDYPDLKPFRSQMIRLSKAKKVLNKPASSAIAGQAPSCPEQLDFGAEESVRCPAKLPAQIRALFVKDPDVQDALSAMNLPRNRVPPSWYRASEVKLGGLDERSFVVIGEGPLAGANITTFWIFRISRAGAGVLLKAPSLGLTILATRSEGYRDIELQAATAVRLSKVLLKFKNGRYTVFRRKSDEIR
jgi:hypothetical protein